jgi:hypothetical protein
LLNFLFFFYFHDAFPSLALPSSVVIIISLARFDPAAAEFFTRNREI